MDKYVNIDLNEWYKIFETYEIIYKKRKYSDKLFSYSFTCLAIP